MSCEKQQMSFCLSRQYFMHTICSMFTVHLHSENQSQCTVSLPCVTAFNLGELCTAESCSALQIHVTYICSTSVVHHVRIQIVKTIHIYVI